MAQIQWENEVLKSIPSREGIPELNAQNTERLCGNLRDKQVASFGGLLWFQVAVELEQATYENKRGHAVKTRMWISKIELIC